MTVINMESNSEHFFAHQPIVRTVNGEIIAHELLLKKYKNMANVNSLDGPDMFCVYLDDLLRCKAETVKHLIIKEGFATIFVHFTPDIIAHPTFIKSLEHFYKQGIAPSCIAIEVTVLNLDHDIDFFYSNLRKARKIGHPIVVDDFGTGFNNFDHVRQLRPSIVKTDKALLTSSIDDKYCFDFLRNLVIFLHQIGCKTVIVGVEDKAHYNVAALCRSDYVQGYHFGRPQNVSSASFVNVDTEKSISNRLDCLFNDHEHVFYNY